MSAENLFSFSLEQLRAKTKDRQIVLLYPWSSYRNVFLAHFVQSPDSQLLYFCPSGTYQMLSAWLKDMINQLDDNLDGPFRNLRKALTTSDPIQMGEALAADLNAFSDNQPRIVFIDEFDRVIFDEDLKTFLQTLVAALSPGIQLVFNGRCFSLDTWYEMIVSGKICVLSTETRPDDVMFTVDKRRRPQLEVYAFGQGHVFVNGQEITQWDGALPRNLFFYFMDHPLTTRDEIFKVFWPNLSTKEATNVFHVTKRKISERISAKVGDHANYEMTNYKTGFYVPSEKVMRHYDVGEFQYSIEQAMIAMSDEKEKALLTRAITLYKNDYLTTIPMGWSVERRDQLRQLYAQALISMARLHQRNHESSQALGYFTQALKQTPQREDIHREVMNIYLQQERYVDAARQYHALEQIINETLQIAPDRESQALFDLVQTHR